MNKINIGILGATEIANRVLIGPAKGIDSIFIYGIAARDLNRAKAYANKFQIPYAFKDYNALINSDQIDIVYIPLINTLHSYWIVKTAEAKKHILVEKPICLNIEEIHSIQQAVKEYEIKIVEGLMVQHHPWVIKIKEIIRTEIYGKLLAISTNIAYPFSDEYLNSYIEKGGGVFIQDSIYWLHLTQICFGLQPISIKGQSDFTGPNGIDTDFKARLEFHSGVYSLFNGSFKKSFQTQHCLQFEHAEIIIKNFIKPSFGNYKMSWGIYDFKKNKKEKVIFEAQSYFKNQMDFLFKIINDGSHNIYLRESFERVKIMEQIYKIAQN